MIPLTSLSIIKGVVHKAKARYIGETTQYDPSTMKETGHWQMYDATGEWVKTKQPGLIEKIAHKVASKFKGAQPAAHAAMLHTKTKINRYLHPEDRTVFERFDPESEEQVKTRIKEIVSKWPKS